MSVVAAQALGGSEPILTDAATGANDCYFAWPSIHRTERHLGPRCSALSVVLIQRRIRQPKSNLEKVMQHDGQQ